MPLYEYYCPICQERFEQLRPMSAAAEAAICPTGHQGARRAVSLFSAVSTAERGEYLPLAGGCACGGACSCGSGAA